MHVMVVNTTVKVFMQFVWKCDIRLAKD